MESIDRGQGSVRKPCTAVSMLYLASHSCYCWCCGLDMKCPPNGTCVTFGSCTAEAVRP